MTIAERNAVLDGAIKLYVEDGVGLGHTLAWVGDNECTVCALGALIVGAGIRTCSTLAADLQSMANENFYEMCRPGDGPMTPLREAVAAVSKALEGDPTNYDNTVSEVRRIYRFSDRKRTPQPIIELFRRAKEL